MFKLETDLFTISDAIKMFEIIFPVIVSAFAFVFSLISQIKVKEEVRKREALKFSDAFASIEYDITEILQLCVIRAKGISANNIDDINKFFSFYIPNNRTSNGYTLPTTDAQERIYRLCGYICSYGSEEAIKLFCLLQNEYTNKCDKNNINTIIAILALLVKTLRYDASKVRINYDEWINIRLPNFDGDKNEIYEECKRIDKEIKAAIKKGKKK